MTCGVAMGEAIAREVVMRLGGLRMVYGGLRSVMFLARLVSSRPARAEKRQSGFRRQSASANAQSAMPNERIKGEESPSEDSMRLPSCRCDVYRNTQHT